MTPFDAPGKILLKTLWEKGEIARNEQFLLYSQCFLPVERSFCYLHQIQNCHLQIVSIWTGLKFCHPARVAQWRACGTHDLVVVSSIPG